MRVEHEVRMPAGVASGKDARRYGSGRSQQNVLAKFYFVLLLATVLLTGSNLSAATNTAARWPSLAEVLQNWDAVAFDDVRKAAEGGELTAQHYLGYCHAEGLRVSPDAQQAIRWYERAGKAGYMPSFNNLGVMYDKGRIVPRDVDRAIRYLELSAKGGFAPAQVGLAWIYVNENGARRDPALAMKWFRLAADQGNANAMVGLGRLYRFGDGVPKDLDEAIKWFTRAMEKGDSLAMLNLGMLYEEEPSLQAEETAFQLYQRAADAGNADAMFKVYWCYWRGIGVAQNREVAMQWVEKSAKAGSAYGQADFAYQNQYYLGDRRTADPIEWYRKAAAQNHSGAMYELGLHYLNTRDEPQGLDWIRKAADLNHTDALNQLVEMYDKGIGEPRNEADRPLNLLLRLAELAANGAESAQPQSQLALRYRYGFGTDRDLVEAARWFLIDPYQGSERQSQNDKMPIVSNDRFADVLRLYGRAAKPNNPEAMMQLGNMYLTGSDAPVNPVKAWSWFKLAAEQGSTAARAKLAKIETQLTADQLTAARKQLTGMNEALSQAPEALKIIFKDTNKQ